jgi:hypothetical protein
VWITLLALKDKDGMVQSSVVGLAYTAKVSLAECEAALLVLSSPDKNDTSKVDEGRRIREVKGGWQIINHELYQFSTEEKREYWRQKKAAERARKPRRSRQNNGPMPGFSASMMAAEAGSQEGVDAIENDLDEQREIRKRESELKQLGKDDETPF